MIYTVCGVSGCGKTTVGTMLSKQLGLPFYDGDDFHPEANIQKMSSGQALNDQDRESWLEQLSLMIVEWEEEGGAVLACSALKEYYRQLLIAIPPQNVRWIVLHGTIDLISERMSRRKNHFFKPQLLQSQFEIFETPTYGWHFNIEDTTEDIVQGILEKHRASAHDH